MACYSCPECNYVYDEQKGAPREGYAPGTRWETIADDFACPECSVRWKEEFIPAELSQLSQ